MYVAVPAITPSLGARSSSLLGSALLLELLVEVIPLVGSRDVVAVPAAKLERFDARLRVVLEAVVRRASYQKALPKANPRPVHCSLAIIPTQACDRPSVNFARSVWSPPAIKIASGSLPRAIPRSRMRPRRSIWRRGQLFDPSILGFIARDAEGQQLAAIERLNRGQEHVRQ